MAGTASESGVGGQQHCQSSEALAEWRSSELVENGSPSTSLPYWDSDDDDDRGLKPSDLFGKHTWKIEKFSQINKREHRSNAFEIGGQKWYILIYPQGCDVCNHLSLFLCVDSYEKLLPGWSHFAQFTISVVNKDPKKTKYSDTLHRFCKKEHDWGWKKFMEIPKVSDGFIDADALVIKAQVQVIRERPDRPFRCLDCQYRRELVRVYLTNVEQICRRFVEEIRGKLGKLIEDKASWSSFCTFWLGIDQNARRRMSREKTDSILKVVVKHFFIEKEVTSTLVMDSLYSGLKALEGPTKDKKCNGKYLDAEEPPVPIVCTEKDTFILVDDVLQLLERAAIEPLPPKDEKGPQNRTKDGSSGEDFTKETIEQDERRLTELGRRTIEIFVLYHIFSKIETAYQEAVALKRQEELIREEEEAWMAESEQKTKRGVVDKEKKSKKKQGKQKRNNRRGKDKGKDEKPVVDKCEQEITSDIKNDVLIEETEQAGKLNPIEDISDVSDSIDRIPGLVQPDSEDRDSSPVNWDTDTSEVHPSKHASGPSAVQNGDRKGSSLMDDSSSTCSTDSLPSLVTNGPYSLPKQKSQKTPSRGRHQRAKVTPETTRWASDRIIQQSYAGQANDVSGSKVAESDDAVVHSLKKEEDVSLQRKLTVKEKDEMVKPTEVQTTIVPSSPRSPPKNLPSASVPLKSEATPFAHKTASPKPAEKPMVQQVPVSTEKPKVQQLSSTAERPMAQQVSVTTERPMAQQVSVTTENPTPQQIMSRPIIPEPRQLAPVVSVAQTAAAPSRSVIAAGPLCPDPSTENPSYVAQSYRNVMPPVVSVAQTAPSLPHSVSAAGPSGPDPSTASPNYVTQSYRNTVPPVVSVAQTAPALLHSVAAGPLGPNPSNATPSYVAQSYRNAMPPNSLQSYSHPSAPISAPVYLSQTSERTGLSSIRQGLSFGMVGHDIRQNRPQWPCRPEMDSSRSINRDPSMFIHQSRIQDLASELPVGMSRRQNQSVLADEFPHLDIINDLLADEHGMGLGGANESSPFQSFGNGTHHLTRQFTFPGDLGPPSSSSCRFERTRSYHNGEFYSNYNSTGGQFDSNLIPEANLGSYPNEQIDGLIPNQWQMAGSDLSYLSMRSSENNGFSYHIPEYSNLACAVDGYSIFPPASRH